MCGSSPGWANRRIGFNSRRRVVPQRQGQLSGKEAWAEAYYLAGWHDPWIIRNMNSCLHILLTPQSQHTQEEGNKWVISLGLCTVEAYLFCFVPTVLPSSSCFHRVSFKMNHSYVGHWFKKKKKKEEGRLQGVEGHAENTNGITFNSIPDSRLWPCLTRKAQAAIEMRRMSHLSSSDSWLPHYLSHLLTCFSTS